VPHLIEKSPRFL